MDELKKINSFEIARLAGVSRSTVSKVINNYPDIPNETKEKVLSIINKNGYAPNVSAQLLKGKPQAVFALYIYASKTDVSEDALCQLRSPYVASIISNFISYANQVGYRVLIELIKYNDNEEIIKKDILSLYSSGLIHSSVFLGLTSKSVFIDELASLNLPLAVIDRKVACSSNVFNILTSDYQGSRMATKKLIEEGFKKIAFISGELSKLSAKERMKGYIDEMYDNHLEPMIYEGRYSEQTGKDVAKEICDTNKIIDGIVCASDSIAYGVIKYFNEIDPARLSVLGLTGFDDSPFNDYQVLPLTSVLTCFDVMAKKCIDSLLLKSENHIQMIPVKLIERISSNRR
ncbi:TPA: LacI family DNA-binding transcriptional regulator [Klebsiella variicola]|nr:LacI family DNA-binding transcriptional regulator [Klebsiella variicola]HCA8417322.1 LacI family DNA-binding transcriptional regulator [Klebsiella variicola]HCA9022834.1 LacI family DNA-binding transcriptional regulator [Klebsiella variicola]HCA9039476.1 LacI family DNA-binding transcriptional regulator [Klebsiella variicola]HCA9055694.1 LacI family DNA-binding transcriptional regulator [Klebsiella variicola]